MTETKLYRKGDVFLINDKAFAVLGVDPSNASIGVFLSVGPRFVAVMRLPLGIYRADVSLGNLLDLP